MFITMNAIQISLNGELKATAPLWEHTMTCAISSGTQSDGTNRGLDLRLGGMDDTHFLDYLRLLDLPVGTRMQIELVESAVPDEPTRRLADPSRDEKREREDFEWAKKKYFELRDKYEPKSAGGKNAG